MHSSGVLPAFCPYPVVSEGGCLPREVSAQGMSAWGVHPLWTEFLTHTCENITFPQLRLRTVMKINFAFGFLPQNFGRWQ